MNSAKEPSHSFVVRIWIERREIEEADPIWRGEIEDLEPEDPKDKKAEYFDHLEKLSSYFAKYLQKIGIKINYRRK